jgi:hypothetical protein
MGNRFANQGLASCRPAAGQAVQQSRHTALARPGTDLLRPAPDEMLQLWPVLRRVNRAGNENDPKLIEAIH